MTTSLSRARRERPCLEDLGGDTKLIDAVIRNNHLHVATTRANRRGIQAYGTRDLILARNDLTGLGTQGIFITASTGCLLQANDTSGFALSAPTGADIWLTESTSGCTVVGLGTGVVVDRGTGNLITGISRPAAVGDDVAAGMEAEAKIVKNLQ